MPSILAETIGLVNGGRVRSDIVTTRPHTGRRRNAAAQQAILDAAAELLAGESSARISVAAIAERAGVGKQTIYRWWPSKSAVLLDAMVERAAAAVPPPSTGDIEVDLRSFLRATFAAASANRTALIGALHEALDDPAAMTRLRTFTATRREALIALLDKAHGGQWPAERTAAAVDQVFGMLWYRMIFDHEPLSEAAADELSAAIRALLRDGRDA